MGEFTAEEAVNIANSVLDYHIKGKAIDQIVQDRLLVDQLKKNQKTFPGGKDAITVNVRGAYTTTLQGFSHDDDVGYANPANTKQGSFNWKELHCGIQMTHTELKHAGISVVDSSDSKSIKRHSEIDVIRITDVFDEKIYDMMEGSAVDFHRMMWQDGSQDASVIPGILSLISTAPTTGFTGGIDRALNSWWRNRASMNINAGTPANMELSRTLQREFRQLRRYKKGGKFKMYAGENFIDALEQEARAKGSVTMTGWADKGEIDLGVADVALKGLKVEYEPVLDDLGLTKRAYIIDHSSICLYVMEGEEWKPHTPSRPANKYVMYRALTYTGGLVAKQLNSSGVYSIA